MISYRALRQVSLDLTRRYASAGRKLKAVPLPKFDHAMTLTFDL